MKIQVGKVPLIGSALRPGTLRKCNVSISATKPPRLLIHTNQIASDRGMSKKFIPIHNESTNPNAPLTTAEIIQVIYRFLKLSSICSMHRIPVWKRKFTERKLKMTTVVDFHVHVFPDYLKKVTSI